MNENSSFETGREDWATQPFVRVVTIAATEPNPSVGGRLWSPFSLSVGRVVTERVDTKSAMKNSKALRASQAQRSNARFLLIGKLLIPHDDGGRVSQLNECPSQPTSQPACTCACECEYIVDVSSGRTRSEQTKLPGRFGVGIAAADEYPWHAMSIGKKQGCALSAKT